MEVIFAASVQDMKLVVAVKYDIAFQDKTKLKVDFGVFGLLRLWYEGNINSLIFQWISISFKFSAQTKVQDTKLQITEN